MHRTSIHQDHLTAIKNAALSVLAYYDLFCFPITREEVYLFADMRCKPEQLQQALNYLVSEHYIYSLDKYYALKNDPHMVIRRQNGTATALPLLKMADRVSNILIRFPYVRGIAISGSLSKKYADHNSDIDLFIITAPNRLWIARTLLHLFKKLTFLLNKQHYFCMNYFVDEQNLEITEQNYFTAVETLTLLPLQGDVAFDQFFSANCWTRNFLPNNLLRISTAKPVKSRWFKLSVEAIFNITMGNQFDNRLMKLTAKRWNQKTQEGRLNARGVLMSMLAAKGCAKPDPVNFQAKVLASHQEKLRRLLYKTDHQTA